MSHCIQVIMRRVESHQRRTTCWSHGQSREGRGVLQGLPLGALKMLLLHSTWHSGDGRQLTDLSQGYSIRRLVTTRAVLFFSAPVFFFFKVLEVFYETKGFTKDLQHFLLHFFLRLLLDFFFFFFFLKILEVFHEIKGSTMAYMSVSLRKNFLFLYIVGKTSFF